MEPQLSSPILDQFVLLQVRIVMVGSWKAVGRQAAVMPAVGMQATPLVRVV